MTEISELKAGVVGTGFIGVVHVDALRRLGVEVLGVVGSLRPRCRRNRGGHMKGALLEGGSRCVAHPNSHHFRR
jgi:phosphoglycerate dehydrogenase-like enzyme